MPAPTIDWMKRSRFARGKRSLRQSPEITSTSASPIRCSSAAASRTSTHSTPVPRRKEALAQPIGNMRKTDRQLILGRKHKVSSEFVSYDAMSAVRVLLRAEGTRAHMTARLTRNAHMACFGTNLGVGCPGAPWRALLQTESHAP